MKEHFLTQHQQMVLMEEKDLATHIMETLLLMDVDVVMKDAGKDQQETPIVTVMSNHAGEMTQFVESTEDIYGDNAMTIPEDKASVPQEILVAIQMNVYIYNFKDKMMIVRLHHIKPTTKVVKDIFNMYYQQEQQQQPGIPGRTQVEDSNLEARGTNNFPAGQNDNYYVDHQKQDQNPHGALFPVREAVNQEQKKVRETLFYKNNTLRVNH
jgi:hypothetical protein